VKAYLRSSLAGFFSHTGFWEDFAKTIGTSLVLWVLDNLEQAQGKTKIDWHHADNAVHTQQIGWIA
jgi:hypothetical protein